MINRIQDKLNSDIHFKEILSGSSIAFVFRIGSIALGYLFTLLITRGYGAEAMGIFALSFTVLQIASVISRLGMDTLLLRFTAEHASEKSAKVIIKDMYKKNLLITVPLSILVSVILYFIAPYIAESIFQKPNLATSLQVTAFGVLPITMLFIHREAVRGLKKIMIFSFFNGFAVSLFASIILIVLLYISSNNIMPLYAQILALIITAILSIFVWRHYISLLGHGRANNKELKDELITKRKMLSIALPMMLAGSLFMIMQWADTFMLGIYSTTEEVGIYNVALKVSAVTGIVLIAINSIAAPKFAEMWGKKDIKGLERIVKQSTKMIFWSSLPFLFLIWLFPSFILGIFGEQFESAVLALILLSLGQFINAISGSVNNLLNMTGYEKVVQNNIAIALVINILLNYFLIPIYGINGAAFASLVSMIFWNLSGVVYIWYKFNFWTIYIPFPIKIFKRSK